ncbi:MAG: UvrD-helicase domain-containing protein [Clostridium sp.]|nr:UvrD-helicase domain-containing protein [Clostridium sp.]
MEDYLSKLNDQQRAAVEYCSGPQLVIAGAGSGKTRVLTYKIVHLLAHDVEPWRIMALTFTNKAAREMRERIQALVGPKIASKLWMGTFHSIFSRLLRSHAELIGFTSNFTIYDSADSKSLVKMIIKDMDLDDKVYKPNVALNAISSAKNALIGPSAYAMDKEIIEADRRVKRPRMAEVYAAYVNRCHVAGAMDFDDLLYYTNVLLRENPEVLNHYKEYFRYVLVDEYQDTNFAQHSIVSLLTQESGNLCVVGDDAQSIYSFRGANIRNILNLKKAYPNLTINKLEQNYRSTQNIINAANSLIEKNKEQIPKRVFSRNSPGDRIEVVKSYSDFEEAFLVSNRISQQKMKTGDSYEEFAILYRTNAQSRVLEEALRRRNIPYRIYGGLSFYQRKEIKDAVAYFRLSINPHDDESLKRIINFPARGIGETTVRKISSAAISNSVSMWEAMSDPLRYGIDINKGTTAKLDAFRQLIQGFIDYNTEGRDAYETAKKIVADTRLLSMLISDRTPESVSKQENLQELLNGVQEYVAGKLEEGLAEEVMMPQFLQQVSLATDQDASDESGQDKVTLMTIHAAKGLEFGNIFIVGVEEELMPSAMSMDNPMEIEEERRLLYVAITRAKRFCMMTYASSRFRNGMTAATKPSRFLQDIDSKWLEFTKGTIPTQADMISKARASFHSPVSPRRPASATSAIPTPSFGIGAKRPQAPAFGMSAGETHTPGELEEGMRIEHSRFGKGTIIDVDTSQPDAKIRVRFDNVDVKTLLLKFARFTIL